MALTSAVGSVAPNGAFNTIPLQGAAPHLRIGRSNQICPDGQTFVHPIADHGGDLALGDGADDFQLSAIQTTCKGRDNTQVPGHSAIHPHRVDLQRAWPSCLQHSGEQGRPVN